jgi:hypothetical protein
MTSPISTSPQTRSVNFDIVVKMHEENTIEKQELLYKINLLQSNLEESLSALKESETGLVHNSLGLSSDSCFPSHIHLGERFHYFTGIREESLPDRIKRISRELGLSE